MSARRPPADAGRPAVTAAHFFQAIVPQLLGAQAERCRGFGGVFLIKLSGAGGGSWTLDFPTASVSTTPPRKAHLTLEMPAADFLKMMQGALDVRAALHDGRLKVLGDPARMGQLAAVLGGSR